jgi:multiple sugar transport system permease protein
MSRLLSRSLTFIILAVAALAITAPFLWIFRGAFSGSDAELYRLPPTFHADNLTTGNFGKVTEQVPYFRFFLNSIIVSSTITVAQLITCSTAGYAFARLRFRGRDRLFLVFLGTLMVPQEVTVVPMFILMQQFGWVDSYAALIFPWAFTAFGTFLLRQFFLSIPSELEEAATIDGAGRLRILLQVVVPIAKPAVAVLAAFTFINYWNSFLWPLIVVNSREMSTVPLGLNLFLSQNGNQWHLLMAASAISMVPTVVMVVLLQRHLVRGIALSGLGGR